VEMYWTSTRSADLEAELERAANEDIGIIDPVYVDVIANEWNSEIIEATLGSCQGIITRRITVSEAASTTPDGSLRVTDIRSHSQLRGYGRPIWVLWDDTARDAPRPRDSEVAGVFVAQSSSRRLAAWWAKV